jgi:hypothetical protein
MNPLHNRLAAHLLSAFAVAGQGDTSDHDGEALASALATATELREAIAAVVRSARADEIMVKRLADDITALQIRKSRLEVRAQRKREIALATMIEAGDGFARIEAHDITASIRAGDRELVVLDETVIPAKFFDTPPPKLRRSDLKRALKDGADVLGATLSNGPAVLQISNK